MNQTIEQALHWRYATKKFDPTKKISEQDQKTLWDSLVQTPLRMGFR